jgi:crossover junction endodeoxyribonuclease RuvC
MIIFGIDPGTAITGYGVIETSGNHVQWRDSGGIRTKSEDSLDGKLVTVFNGLREVMTRYPVDKICVEEAFYHKNARTALILGHVRGICILAAGMLEKPVEEYTPRKIKKAITGNGNAQKQQVQYMIGILLSPPRTHTCSDAYDALAVALCGFYHHTHVSVAAGTKSKKSL